MTIQKVGRSSRRRLIKMTAVAATGVLGAPAIVRGATAGQVFIRSTGGSVEEAKRKSWFEPFTAETGITVTPVPITPARIIAMVRANNVTLDIPSTSAFGLAALEKQGAVEPFDTSKIKRTNLADLNAVERHWVSESAYATVLAYRTTAFPNGAPRSWADFWNVARFPGRRMLQDPSFGAIDLEQALLADGVSMSNLYPIDLERAFRKLGEIRSHIVKWWDSGAVSAQMLADGVADCGSIWDSRAQTLIDAGAPIAVEWNQAMRNTQATAVTKGAPNREAAYQLIDYGLQPRVQAALATAAKLSPANRRAFEFIAPEIAQRLCTYPAYADIGFTNNAQWWADNGPRVIERFRQFRLAN